MPLPSRHAKLGAQIAAALEQADLPQGVNYRFKGDAEKMVETIVEEQVGVDMLAATVQLELSGSEVGVEDGLHSSRAAGGGCSEPAGRQMCQLAR